MGVKEHILMVPLSLGSRCKRGHEITEENLYINPSGHKTCLTCYRMSSEEKHAIDSSVNFDLNRFNQYYIVDELTGCWNWTGYKNNGYGVFRVNGKNINAHSWSYKHFVGPVIKGLELDHLCKNKSCVNPSHLEAVTHQENMIRADAGKKTGKLNRAKTHCRNGHAYTLENTYVDKRGSRLCRQCNKTAGEKWRSKL